MSTEYSRLVTVADALFGSVSKLAIALGKSQNHLYTYQQYDGFGKKVLGMFEDVGINRDYIMDGSDWWFADNDAGRKLAEDYKESNPHQYQALLAHRLEQQRSKSIATGDYIPPAQNNIVIFTTYDDLRKLLKELYDPNNDKKPEEK